MKFDLFCFREEIATRKTGWYKRIQMKFHLQLFSSYFHRYRRFEAASRGAVFDQDLAIPKMRLVKDGDLQTAAAKTAIQLIMPKDANPAIAATNSK